MRKKSYVVPRTAMVDAVVKCCLFTASMVGGCPDSHGDCGGMPQMGTDGEEYWDL